MMFISFIVEWSPGDSQSTLGLNFNDGGYPLCKVCGKVFKHQGSLVAHYQVSELGVAYVKIVIILHN